MTNERFNELLRGPLHHPMPQFVMTRLVLALRDVVEATGEAGEKALEEHCAAREAQDRKEYDEAQDDDFEDDQDEWDEDHPY